MRLHHSGLFYYCSMLCYNDVDYFKGAGYMIHTFIFDVDGTIVDTEDSIFRGLDDVLQEHAGRPATP